MMPPLVSVLTLPLAVAGFLIPGWLLSRRIKSPDPVITTFLGACAILFCVVLLFTMIRVPLRAGTVGLALAGVALLLAWKAPPTSPAEAHAAGPPDRLQWIWWPAVALALGSIALHAVVNPLSGYDTPFRWDYLGKVMVAHESLASYPPVTSSDFELYGWCDGIPPMVPVLHFWIYAVTRSTAPVLTAVRVVGEAVVIGYGVAGLSRKLWGHAAGPAALAVLATSSLMLWSVAIGQESGLLALSLVSLLYLLVTHDKTPGPATAFWAAVAAAVGALAREYALAFTVVGFAALVFQRAPRRNVAIYVATVLVLCAPWYVRNWVITGNPLYPHAVGGLFPTNPVHAEIMRSIASEWSFSTSPLNVAYVPKYLAATAGIAVFVGLIGAARSRRYSVLLGSALLLIAALWLWSVPQTGGGWVYSGRVLAPLVAVAAAAGGWIVTSRRSVQVALAAVGVVLAADAAQRSWLLPLAPLTWSRERWLTLKRQINAVNDPRIWNILAQAAQGQGIVVDQPLYHSMVVAGGGRAIPLMSPLLAPTLPRTAPFQETLALLRQANIRFVAVNPAAPAMRDFAAAHPFWGELCYQHEPAVRTPMAIIYDLNDLRRMTRG